MLARSSWVPVYEVLIAVFLFHCLPGYKPVPEDPQSLLIPLSKLDQVCPADLSVG